MSDAARAKSPGSDAASTAAGSDIGVALCALDGARALDANAGLSSVMRHVGPMARRVLNSTHATMQILATAAMALSSAGCLVPVALEQQSGTTHPPVITEGVPSFLVHPYVSTLASDWIFSVTATDEDLTSTLQAQLYFSEGGPLGLVGPSITLAPSGRDSLTRRGDFPSTPYCADLHVNTDYYFYVYVTNLGFPASNNVKDFPEGHFDYKYWVVRCQ